MKLVNLLLLSFIHVALGDDSRNSIAARAENAELGAGESLYVLELRPPFQTPVKWLVMSSPSSVSIWVERSKAEGGEVEVSYDQHVQTDGHHLETYNSQVGQILEMEVRRGAVLDGTYFRFEYRAEDGISKSLGGILLGIPTKTDEANDELDKLILWLMETTGIYPRFVFRSELTD